MVRKKECAALVRLYDREIIRCLEHIYRDSEKGEVFEELLSLGRINELLEEYEDPVDFAKQLFKELNESPLSQADNERLYKDVLTYLHKNFETSPVHRLLTCSDKTIIRSSFGYILNNLDGFLSYLDPETLLTHLDADPQYQDLVRTFREWQDTSESEEENIEYKKKAMLKMIPLYQEGAVYEVMFCIHERCSNDINEEAKLFIETVLNLKRRNFLPFYEMVTADRVRCNGRMYVCPIHESATEMVVFIGSPALNRTRYRMINIRHDNIQSEESIPRLVIQYVRNRVELQRQLCLRRYQEELCKVALRGENTIVTAPTGSGKTVIAANIIKNHFERREREGKRFKALFMTPNSMILKQQSDSISSYLDQAYHVQIVQGSENTPVRSVVESKDLIVATPQMIVNLCNEHKDELLRENDIGLKQFYLSTFTIIFFDECHSTMKNSPYWNIMREYHTLKNTGNMPEGHKLPQIIGLTASLGTGDAKNVLGVQDYIASLCANLDVKELSIVKENMSELRDYSPIIPDKITYCDKSVDGAIGTFSKLMFEMMKEIEKIIRTALVNEHIQIQAAQDVQLLETREYTRATSYMAAPDDKEHSGYLNWVCNQMNLVSTTKFRENRTKIQINEALEVLKECYWTLSYNTNFNPKVALKFLLNELENRRRNFTHQMTMICENYQHQLASTGNAENSMIAKVKEFVIDENQRNNRSRAIIFVRTRYEATILNDILNECEVLQQLGIQSDWISGFNKQTGKAELTASKQKQTDKLRKFTSGETRILVSTSVAEEGLDIAECSLVIKYNYATNEIAHVQRRGRGRAHNSTCVLITNSKELRDQESSNRDKENMMNQALHMIQMNPSSFKEKVTQEINNIYHRIRREDTEKAQQENEQIANNVIYRIVCKKCDIILCKSSDMRSRNNTQYFVCDPLFWKLVRKLGLSLAEMNEGSRCHSTGKILCLGQNCGAMLGRLIDVNSTDLPCLGADAIVLINDESGERFTVKKWKNILAKHFIPISLRSLDVQKMKDGNRTHTMLNFEVHRDGIIENINREI